MYCLSLLTRVLLSNKSFRSFSSNFFSDSTILCEKYDVFLKRAKNVMLLQRETTSATNESVLKLAFRPWEASGSDKVA